MAWSGAGIPSSSVTLTEFPFSLVFLVCVVFIIFLKIFYASIGREEEIIISHSGWFLFGK